MVRHHPRVIRHVPLHTRLSFEPYANCVMLFGDGTTTYHIGVSVQRRCVLKSFEKILHEERAAVAAL